MESQPKPFLTRTFSQFRDASMEHAYRQSARSADQRLSSIIATIIFGSFILISLGEWFDARGLPVGDEQHRFILRSLAVPLFAYLTFRAIKLTGTPVGDAIKSLILVVGLLIAVYMQYLWPPEYVGCTYVLVFVVFLHPLPLRMLTVVSLIFSAALVWLYVTYKAPVIEKDREFVLWSILCLNLLGFVTNRHIGTQRRFAYFAGIQERTAREESERARQELRVLKGLIPICSSCKKIRDDAGDWQQMEKYIAARSEAEFTHGICDHCAEEFLRHAKVREL